MKHADMIPLMGKIVTVCSRLTRREYYGGKVEWHRLVGLSQAGWIVGFTYKQDGKIVYREEEEPNSFHETSRQLCVLVKPWPTMNAVPVPLDGYTEGGVPVGPNAKG